MGSGNPMGASITLFAPTDAAFARVPADQLAALASNTTELQRVLGYHAVLDKAVFLDGQHDKTLMSSTGVKIIVRAHTVLNVIAAEGVDVAERNIRVANGYVHVLGGIMTPPEGDVVDVIKANGELTSFMSLLSSTGLDDFLRASNEFNLSVGMGIFIYVEQCGSVVSASDL
ncbi:transforming growth factor-beta-induced protein ig-h3 [Elysia marginata]|uniref:Transforming growth factor-beta-induced protein ig-h3 n=1 Tax=Elysia marginata TaxID=1093978 RepID=A0AAV4H7L3_9GAST|nr:transforming growth factor-beta-induced protein ig-h3 [Elysia marginata]